MRITFVRPNLHAGRSADAMQPLAFAVLAAATPRDVECVLHDERLAPVPLDEPTDLVAMTVETYTARRAYQLATAYRRRGVPVVMGGYHPTFLPDECAHFADALVLGDAEALWPRVVADARRGQLRPIYRQAGFPSLTGRPLPDRTLFQGKRYAPVTLVQYGRGCRFACDFCSIHAFYGRSLRQRAIADVVADIERGGHRLVFFVDDNLFVDVARARALFEAIAPLGIRWTCQASLDIARDRALVRLMARSGCVSVLFGFESLDVRNLVQMKKGWNVRWQDYETAIGVVQDAGLMIYGTFVHGYDGDTPQSFDDTVDFAIRHRFFLANFNPLTPTPRAPLYDRLAAEGRLLYDRWWLDERFRYGAATFVPKGMTPDELTAGCWRARQAFNTAASIAHRFVTPTTLLHPWQAAQFLLGNLISRREIRAKQGVALGGPEPLDLPRDLGAVPTARGWRDGDGAGADAGGDAPSGAHADAGPNEPLGAEADADAAALTPSGAGGGA
ncbi:MAG TPA: radical SAM protein [Gemmatimonadaceae bacterium]|nr:radical SAM protein [Gemmatimonadaceae bacterium]